jgi:hypothetical protein
MIRARLADFENSGPLFAAVHRSFKFALLTLGFNQATVRFAFYLTDPNQLDEMERNSVLSADDIALISPNTKTAPVLRSRADAMLIANIYRKVPIICAEKAHEKNDRWSFQYMTKMFGMADSSSIFFTVDSLEDIGATRDGTDWVKKMGNERYKRWLPLLEAKMIGLYDHRAGSYQSRSGARGSRVLPETKLEEYIDPYYEVEPFYWVEEKDVEGRMVGRPWNKKWLMGWKDVTTATTERTAISSVFPWCAVGHSVRVMFIEGGAAPPAVLVANLSSLVTDYVVRQKLSYLHLTVEILKQIPVLPPSFYSLERCYFINPKILELIYTSHSMSPGHVRQAGGDSRAS